MLQQDDSQYRLSKNHPPKMAGCVTPRATLKRGFPVVRIGVRRIVFGRYCNLFL